MAFQQGKILQNRWKLAGKLCVGRNSNVFLAYSKKGGQYAVKVDGACWIKDEKKIYDILHHRSSPTRPPKGILRVIAHGFEGEQGFLVFPRLSVSIHQLWCMSQRRFSHATIAKIAVQAIRRLEFVHSRGIVHGDVTARNLVMGASGDESTIYLIDYGNSIKFTDELRGGMFEPDDSDSDSDADCDSTKAKCPRDDLRALVKMLIRLHRGVNRNWLKEVEPAPEQRGLRKYFSCLQEQIRPRRSGKVKHYWEYIRYVDQLRPTQIPNYRFLKDLFKTYLESIGDKYNNKFQWMGARTYETSIRNPAPRRDGYYSPFVRET